jgi:hypothetical protein
MTTPATQDADTIDGDFAEVHPVAEEPRELATITTEIVSRQQVLPAERDYAMAFEPTNMQELMVLCEALGKAGDAIPRSYQGKPGAIMVAIRAGRELGLSSMKSLQGIAVINGVPSLFGKTALAMVQRHKEYEDVEEWFEGTPEDEDFAAHIIVRRRGRADIHRSFSRKDAERIKVYSSSGDVRLWNKPGPWKDGYKARMCQWRARAIAFADAFPDALLGFGIVEEMIDVTPQAAPTAVASRSGGLTRASVILDSVKAREKTPDAADESVVMAKGTRSVEAPPPPAAAPKADAPTFCVKCGDSKRDHKKDGTCAGECGGQACAFEAEPPNAFNEGEAAVAQAAADRKSDVLNAENEDDVARDIAGELDFTTAKTIVKSAIAANMTSTALTDLIFQLTGGYALKKGPTVSAIMGALRSKAQP